MTIGIFDSGKGAYLVAERLRPLFPEHNFRVVTDEEHVPYGDRNPGEILKLVELALKPLLDECPIVILACNTATAVAIDKLRESHPSHTFIGFEPMIRPAADLTDSGHVTILATTATRRSERYQTLVRSYGAHLTIHEPNTDEWAARIEKDDADSIDIKEVIDSVSNHESDVIALACTHYLALEKRLREILPHTTVIEPTPAIARQLTQILGKTPQL